MLPVYISMRGLHIPYFLNVWYDISKDFYITRENVSKVYFAIIAIKQVDFFKFLTIV